MEASKRPATLAEALRQLQRLETELAEALTGMRSSLHSVVLGNSDYGDRYLIWLHSRWPEVVSVSDRDTAGQALLQLGWDSLVSLIAALRLDQNLEDTEWYQIALGRVRGIEQMVEWHNELAEETNRRNDTFIKRLLCQTRPIAGLTAQQPDPMPSFRHSLGTLRPASVPPGSPPRRQDLSAGSTPAGTGSLEFPARDAAANE